MDKKTFESLLDKYKSGHCTSDEEKLIYLWYNKFSDMQPSNPPPFALEEISTASWDKISKQIAKPQRLRLWQTAAAVLLLGTISSLLYVFSDYQYQDWDKQAQDFTRANSQHITHDNSSAQLRLADGTILSLEKQEDIILFTALNNQANTAVQELTVSTSKGSSFHVTLPDGSTVLLSPLSKISFPSAFTGHKRQVLLEGEAYFDVVKKQSNNSPAHQEFEVISGQQTVTVLGTKFSISHHPEEPQTFTTLEEGSVRVQSTNLPHLHSQILKPGEQAAYSSTGLQVYPVDLDLALAWKNGEFAFSNQSLEKLIQQISLWYNVDFEWVNAKNKKETFEGFFPKEKSITAVLQAIENTGKVEFKIKDRTIYIL